MKTELAYYDIFPKVLLAGRETTITVKPLEPLSDHVRFSGTRATITVLNMREAQRFGADNRYPVIEAVPQEGILRFTHRFEREGMYGLTIRYGDKGDREVTLRVYAVREDLYGLRPYRGDMHVHSFRSDGREAPAIVAANYRKEGFDFMGLTDHGQYEPSLEAIRAYQDAPLGLRLFPGEEVHPPVRSSLGFPRTPPEMGEWFPHFLHFGGDYSVNAVFHNDLDRYKAEVGELFRTLETPPEVDRLAYAVGVWVSREIHKAHGLSMLVHPCWIDDGVYHVPEALWAHFIKTKVFDAFELIGGQSVQENLAQVSLWQQLRAEGFFIPPVGNSDSHGTVNGAWFNISKSIVFTRSLEREDLFQAIREARCVAVEQYHGEPLPRLYGDHRYVSFALFLMDEYFPLHDELCFEEGRLMKDYVCGGAPGSSREETRALLGALRGRCAALLDHYWSAS